MITLEIGKLYRSRNGQRNVTVVGDWSLSGEEKQYRMICSDRIDRDIEGRVANCDVNLPLDLVEEI